MERGTHRASVELSTEPRESAPPLPFRVLRSAFRLSSSSPPHARQHARGHQCHEQTRATVRNERQGDARGGGRSEERRVGEEGRYRWSPDHYKKKKKREENSK